jgi:hypothetical protein
MFYVDSMIRMLGTPSIKYVSSIYDDNNNSSMISATTYKYL